MKRHQKELFYYCLITIVSVALSLFIQRVINSTSFQAVGSRFTGEDAIWLLENSNIILTPGTSIDGQSTPFREYINSHP